MIQKIIVPLVVIIYFLNRDLILPVLSGSTALRPLAGFI